MGRLIDADVLREYWHISEKCEECHWNNRDCSKPPYYSLHDICEAIDEAPTIDAIPVEWLWAAQDKMLESPRFNFEQCAVVGQLIRAWQKEQEAR